MKLLRLSCPGCSPYGTVSKSPYLLVQILGAGSGQVHRRGNESELTAGGRGLIAGGNRLPAKLIVVVDGMGRFVGERPTSGGRIRGLERDGLVVGRSAFVVGRRRQVIQIA